MLNRAFVLTGVLMLLMAVILYLVLGKQASDALVEQMLHREQLATRAGANSFEIFFNLFSRSLLIQAEREITNSVLNNFSLRWDGTPVAGAILVDESGRVKFNGNRLQAPEVGEDLSDRDYFAWAKTAKKGEVFISSPAISRLGASKGKYIVGVATPIIDDRGVFKGLLSAAVILDEMVGQYLESMKVTEKSLIYLTDEGGDIVLTNQSDVLGKNFFEEISKRPFLGSKVLAEKLRRILSLRQEGKLDIAAPERMLIAYAPVAVGNNHLMLGIATPVSDALVFLSPFYFRNLAVIALAFLGFLVIAIRIAKITSYKEAVKVEHQIHKIKESV